MQTGSLKAELDSESIQILIFVDFTMYKMVGESKKSDQNLTFCSGGGSRTHTPSQAHDFESCASASSATPPKSIIINSSLIAELSI
jgi:hypothetical protein